MAVPGHNVVLDAALSYMGRGWGVIDLPLGSKNPGRSGWQNERYDEETIRRRISGGSATSVSCSVSPPVASST